MEECDSRSYRSVSFTNHPSIPFLLYGVWYSVVTRFFLRPSPLPQRNTIIIMSLRVLSSHVLRPAWKASRKRNLSFSFAGPRQLDEILKKDMVIDKSASEVSDLWFAYHDSKVRNAVPFRSAYISFMVVYQF